MTDSVTKRRIWIRNILIIFLTVLLLLTFFSNTILNRSLPEVSVEYPSWGTISQKVTATGTVRANQTYDVVMEQTRTVAGVNVYVGQRIEKGTVLMTLIDGSSKELEDARRALSDLELSRIEKLRQDPSKSAGEKAAALAALRSQVTEAEASLAALNRAYEVLLDKQKNAPDVMEVQAAKASVVQEKAFIEDMDKEIERLKGKRGQDASAGFYSEAELAELIGEAQYHLGEAEYEHTAAAADLSRAELALKNKNAAYDSAKASYDAAAAALSQYEGSFSSAITEESLEKQRQDIETQEAALNRAKQYFSENEYTTAKQNYTSAKAEYDSNYATDNDDARAARKKKVDDAAAVLKPLETEYLSIRSMEEALVEAENTYQQNYYAFITGSNSSRLLEMMRAQANSAKSTMDARQKEVTAAEKAVSDAKEKADGAAKILAEKQAKLDELESYAAYEEYTALIKEAEQKKADAQERLAEAEATVLAGDDDQKIALAEEIGKKGREVAAQKQQVEALKRQLSEAENGTDADLDQQQFEIELARIDESIKKQQEVVDKLAATEIGGTITSPVSGVVASLPYTVGKEITANSIAAQITLSEAGYTMEVSVSAREAARIKEGDTAEIRWYYWGETPTARVVSVKSAGAMSQQKTVVLSVTGQVEEGTSLTVSIGGQDQSYDNVIPLAAVREDQEGKFVLVVQEKSTPLGNRYTAKRVNVEVITSDATHAAVLGDIAGQYVITASAEPISSGSAVRLKEED